MEIFVFAVVVLMVASLVLARSRRTGSGDGYVHGGEDGVSMDDGLDVRRAGAWIGPGGPMKGSGGGNVQGGG